MPDYSLHNYFRSSTSIRVRIALNLKGLDYSYIPVHLVKGDQHNDEFRRLNPQGLVPTLIIEGAQALSQSLAIIEYLDEVHVEPPLLPAEPLARAEVRSLAQIIGCDIHPINNLRVLKYLKAHFGAEQDQITGWFQHWAQAGCEAFEQKLSARPRHTYCCGELPGLADICLYAQTINNRRFDVDMSGYPIIMAVFANLQELSAFRDAEPEQQIDAS